MAPEDEPTITVTAPRVDSHAVEVEWEPVAAADHYEITATFKLPKVHGTSHLIGGLRADTDYEFDVTAINAAGQRMLSGQAEAHTVG